MGAEALFPSSKTLFPTGDAGRPVSNVGVAIPEQDTGQVWRLRRLSCALSSAGSCLLNRYVNVCDVRLKSESTTLGTSPMVQQLRLCAPDAEAQS